MSTPPNPRQEQPSTYIVQGRSNEEELTRLQIQDHLVTIGMGGVLPEQPDPARFQRVLDVGCGTGGWLIEAAKTYPTMKLLVGVDASLTFVESARAQAEAEQVSNRVEFLVMDALRMLEFPVKYFDLVNLRFGQSYLRTWDWPKLLLEFQRVTRPKGVVRITESDIVESTSPALTRLSQLTLDTVYQAGHFFTPERKGVTSELARLLQRAGFRQVQTRAFALEYRGGTADGQRFAEDMGHVFRTALPFLRKWTHVPDDYEAIYQQMLSEMQQPDFVATWGMLTVWGYNSPR